MVGMARFGFVTFGLVTLLSLGSLLGGVWVWAALFYMTVFCYGVDRLGPEAWGNPDPSAEFPASGPLSITLAFAHFGVLALGIWAITSESSALSSLEKLGLFMVLSLFAGQVGHPNAHELIHTASRRARFLGKCVYASFLMGHHASAHPLVHHVHVGTDKDPVSARKGRGFWQFFPRAWRGSFTAGFAAETKRRNGRIDRGHPYVLYGVASAVTILCAIAIGGVFGGVVVVLMAFYAQLQVCLSDYVQHYGLRRRILDDGRPEAVGPQHSWNTPHAMSSAMMLNAPRHSDHHTNPTRRYPALHLDPETMPVLPYSLPMMAVIALMPPLWRRIMDPRVAIWEAKADETTGA